MKPVDVIEVLLWGKRVGAATADPTLGCYAFEYEPSWKRQGIELAPLTMPLSDRPFPASSTRDCSEYRRAALGILSLGSLSRHANPFCLRREFRPSKNGIILDEASRKRHLPHQVATYDLDTFRINGIVLPIIVALRFNR